MLKGLTVSKEGYGEEGILDWNRAKRKKKPKPTKSTTNQLQTPRKAGVWGGSYEKEKKLNVSVSLGMQDWFVS